jgi:hypothetical protein
MQNARRTVGRLEFNSNTRQVGPAFSWILGEVGVRVEAGMNSRIISMRKTAHMPTPGIHTPTSGQRRAELRLHARPQNV